jgi:hypothetical protein
MRKAGAMDTIGVKVMTTPRLLADLITAELNTPAVRMWTSGDEPALVTIVNSVDDCATDSRVTIVLGDRLGDPVSVVIDGVWSSLAPTGPHELLRLIVELAQEVSSDGVISAEPCG